MVLTPRDAEILRLVARRRFLRSQHIHSLLGGSRQQLLRRLQRLFQHGYLERPPCQLDYFQSGGSRSMVYGLGNRAAAYLSRIGAYSSHRLDWNTRNRSIHRLFLDHALMISDILVALEIACRARNDVCLSIMDDCSPPDSTRPRSEPLRWNVRTTQYGEIGVVPDAVFTLQFTTASEKEMLCCLEADRGTMPVVSQDPQRSSLARKFAAYEASWRDGVFRERFEFARVRVLTVTNAPERIASIENCLRTTTRNSALFTYASLARLLESPHDFLGSLLTETPRGT